MNSARTLNFSKDKLTFLAFIYGSVPIYLFLFALASTIIQSTPHNLH